jgi:hypothetical protein
MQRDMELIRKILMQSEAANGRRVTPADVDGYDETTVIGHYVLLREAGFIDATVKYYMGDSPPIAHVDRITWRGYEFLETIRNDTVWNKTTAFIKAKGGGATLAVLEGVAKKYLTQAMGLDVE